MPQPLTGRRLWHTRNRAEWPLPPPHEGVPQNLAATYTCSGITAYSALKKTRGHLGADDHLVIKGLTIMVNSISNGARMEDVWLDN
jgi:D-arabinose 1-dehydrogenase-like Zn-dependent alcohol dehydrogenase